MNNLEKIEQLVNWKFPTLRAVLASGPMGNISHERRTTLKGQADKYRAELFALSQDNFSALYQKTVEERGRLAEIAARRDEEARFFNQRSALADYHYWTKADYWTLDEAIVLALGRDPNVVTAANLAPFRLTSPFVANFLRLQNLALRAKATGKLFDPVLPVLFVAWAIDKGIDIPAPMRDLIMAQAAPIDWEGHSKKQSDLIELLEKRVTRQQTEIDTLRASLAESEARASAIPAPAEATAKKQSPVERDNMLMVILAVAVDAYGHKPETDRSTTVSDIRNAVEKLGLALSDDTIRRYLNKGEALVPELKERRS